mgnify:CR=1 FL=1
MARIHFFKMPETFEFDDCATVSERLTKALQELGCPNDKVLVTNFDYQGTVDMLDEFAMFGGK